MIQVFKTDEDYKKWLDGQTLPSGIVVYVSDDETMYFSTNNIKGELKTYECKKDEVIQYPPLIYSAKSAGSTITVNGQSMTLEQGDNMVLNYPNEITSVEATGNEELTYLQIPNTVTSINDNAFTGCTELTDFRYNGTVEEWGAITLGTDWNKDAGFIVVHCTDGDVTLEEPIQPIQPNNLVYSTNAAGSTITVNGETVTLEQGENIVLDYPNEITSINARNNKALTYIQIPNTVKSIKNRVFNGCTSLVSVNIPDTVTSIGDNAFARSSLTSITIPDGVTSIGYSAFENCAALTDFNYNGTMAQWASITLGDSWKSGAPFTVVHCTDGDVTLEEPIQYPPLIYSAKSAGSKLTVNGEKVTLEQGDNITLDYPNEITSVIGQNNTALTAITIPNTVTSIESLAFNSCPYLASVTLPDTLQTIGDSAFARTSLTSITIPDGVTSIESNAFNGCGSLVSINIPEGITSISGFVFGMCTSLSSISIPNSVTSIGEYSFQVCSSLTSITIPENVRSIGDSAFNGCAALTDFNFNGTKAQWGAITLGTYWKNNAAFTVVHCSDGDVTL